MMRTRPGNDSFSLPVLKAEPTPASFHHPSCQVPEDGNDRVDLFAIGSRAFLCFQSKRLINQKCLFQITSVTQSLLYEKSRAESVSLLNPSVILKTGSSTSPPAHETRNLFSLPPTGLKNRGGGFQLGELFCKYTKYFYSFLVLGKGINFP